MTDIQKLKALAEAANKEFPLAPWAYEAHGDSGSYGIGVLQNERELYVLGRQDAGEMLVVEPVAMDVSQEKYAAFIAASNPAAVLELIAEIERITGENQRLRAGVESDLAEIDRIQAVYDAHFRKTRSYRMQRDQAKDESDQLKCENEALRKDAERYRWLRQDDVVQYEISTKCSEEKMDAAIDAAMSKEAQP